MNLYLFLGSLALIFTAFGFCLHAFCFGRERDSPSGRTGENQSHLVQGHPDHPRHAQIDYSKLNATVRSLEHELRLKTEELETLRLLALAPPEGSGYLPKEGQSSRNAPSSRGSARERPGPPPADMRRRSEGGKAKRTPTKPVQVEESKITEVSAEKSGEVGGTLPVEPVGSVEPPKPPVQASAPSQGKSEGRDAASWKENLDSVLNILDEMEKEVQK